MMTLSRVERLFHVKKQAQTDRQEPNFEFSAIPVKPIHNTVINLFKASYKFFFKFD